LAFGGQGGSCRGEKNKANEYYKIKKKTKRSSPGARDFSLRQGARIAHCEERKVKETTGGHGRERERKGPELWLSEHEGIGKRNQPMKRKSAI